MNQTSILLSSIISLCLLWILEFIAYKAVQKPSISVWMEMHLQIITHFMYTINFVLIL